MKLKSQWTYKYEKKPPPEEGKKIEYVMGPNEVEVGVWLNGQIDYREGDWERVIMWRYVKEDT
jgi:hypothetical protein